MELLPLNGAGWQLYLGIALTLLGGAFGLPIPEDIPLITAGVFIGNGTLDPIATWMICYSSVILGDLFIYGVGYRVGFAIFRSPFLSGRVAPETIAKLCSRMERHSIGLILLARHLFYMRTITFLVCGAVRIKPSRFILADALAALLSCTIMLSLGYFASDHLTLLYDFLTKAKRVSLVLALALVTAGAVYLLRRRHLGRISSAAREKSGLDMN